MAKITLDIADKAAMVLSLREAREQATEEDLIHTYARLNQYTWEESFPKVMDAIRYEAAFEQIANSEELYALAMDGIQV